MLCVGTVHVVVPVEVPTREIVTASPRSDPGYSMTLCDMNVDAKRYVLRRNSLARSKPPKPITSAKHKRLNIPANSIDVITNK